MFKNRVYKDVYRPFRLRLGAHGLFLLKRTRFELVYWRRLKKLLRRKYIKTKEIAFIKRRYWIFINPNIILSCKSTNSRMGAGVGAFVRTAAYLKSYCSFVEFRYYSTSALNKIYRATRFRLPFYFIVFKNESD